MARQLAPAPHQPERGRTHQRHVGAQADHHLEGHVDDGHRRPVLARKGQEALDLRARVLEGQQRQPVGDFDRVARLTRRLVGPASDPERRAALGLEVALHGRQLDRLPVGHEARAQVAGDGLEQGRRRPDQQGHGQRATVERVTRLAEQGQGVDARHHEAGGRVGRERHVEHLGEGGRVHHRRDGVDVDGPPFHPAEAGGRVHPGVGDDHEDPGEHAADRDGPARGQVRARGDALPAVQVDSEEDRLGEEGEALEREGHADDGARALHEGGPQQSQLEAQHGAGDGAHREEDGGALGPAVGKIEIDVVAGALPAPLGHHHEDRHGDAHHREEDVEAQRHGHLRARGEEVGHG